jgi:hypothetical protein
MTIQSPFRVPIAIGMRQDQWKSVASVLSAFYSRTRFFASLRMTNIYLPFGEGKGKGNNRGDAQRKIGL